MRTRQTTEQAQVVRDTSWLKSLLNNVPLLKWVRKFSADYMLDDNSMAKRFGIRTNEDSISVADTTMTKLLTTLQVRGEGVYQIQYEAVGRDGGLAGKRRRAHHHRGQQQGNGGADR